MNKDLHKIYQLMDFLVSENSYANLYLKDMMQPGVVWLFNGDNPHYQLIRLSNTPIFYLRNSNNNDLLELINEFSMQNKKKVNFLDIHICNEIVTDEYSFPLATIDTNFHSGIDLSNIFPGIYSVISEVEDQESELKKRISRINESMKAKQKKIRNSNFISRFNFSNYLVTFIVCVICIVLYLISLLLSSKYDNSSVLIFLGADYKMFTLGLKQFYRLLTCAFLHGSFLHLFFNVTAMFSVGSLVEQVLGRAKFLIMLICGIVVGSLAHGVLSGNSLVCGLSAGIYCVFAYMIIYLINDYNMSIQRFLPTIFINLMLNFMPHVSWQAHLGGAVCGILFYYIYQDNKINYAILPVIGILIAGLLFKYIKDYNIKPFYAGTDIQVLEIARDFGFENYANRNEEKLYKIYLNKEN